MNNFNLSGTLRTQLLALSMFFALAACGGGASTEPVPADPPQPTTGTVGLLFTDAPTDEFESILLNVTAAILIGGDDTQEILFQGVEPIDLLNLTNFNEPIVFGEVQVGNYKKLRLIIDNLELVPKDGGDSIFPALPANGKIDLLQSQGFDVLPGRTMLIEIDMDANKSIKITGTGSSRTYNFRPVVKVNILDGGLPHKLARLEGSVSEISASSAGAFVLCDIDSPEHCVDVATNGETGIFDEEGLATGFDTLVVGDMAVVIGSYQTDPAVVLNAVVLEIGGNAVQVKGNVVSNPMNDQFLMVVNGNGDFLVELQAGTKYYDASGAIGVDAIVLGVDVEVEGVQPPKADAADPDVMRAALIFLEADPDEQISGTIAEPLDAAMRSFDLTLAEGGTTSVRVNEDADILLVDVANSTVTMGVFADLAVGQAVDLFGVTAEDTYFDANEVIVEVVAP